MNRILNFDEFIDEGFINKTLKRVRKGEERVENQYTPSLDYLCEFYGRGMSKILKIDYREDLCTWRKTKKTPKYQYYEVSIDFSDVVENMEIISLPEFKIELGFGDLDMLLFTTELRDTFESYRTKLTMTIARHTLSHEYYRLMDCVNDMMTTLSNLIRSVRKDPSYIPDIDDFLDDSVYEGFINKTLKRTRTNTPRIENKPAFDYICEFYAQGMSKILDIPYREDLCVWKKTKKTKKYQHYEVSIDFSDMSKQVGIYTISPIKIELGSDETDMLLFATAFCDSMDNAAKKDLYLKFLTCKYSEFSKLSKVGYLNDLVAGLRNKLRKEQDYTPNIDDFIDEDVLNNINSVDEGFVNKTLKRVRTGEKRIEDINRLPLDILCDFVCDGISLQGDIPYRKELCTWERMTNVRTTQQVFEIKIDLSDLSPRLKDLSFQLVMPKNCDDYDMLNYVHMFTNKFTQYMVHDIYISHLFAVERDVLEKVKHISYTLSNALNDEYLQVKKNRSYVPDFNHCLDRLTEGFINKTLKRTRTGGDRLEDDSILSKSCKLIGQIIADKLEVPYRKSLCSCEQQNGNLEFHFDFSDIDNELGDLVAPCRVAPYCDDDINDFFKFWSTFANSYHILMAHTTPKKYDCLKNDPVKHKRTKDLMYHIGKIMSRIHRESIGSEMSDVPQFEKVKEMMMNEGFLNKTLKRVRTGEERTEDKLNTNLDELKPIDICEDFPFFFADKDFSVVRDDLDDDEYELFDFREGEKFDEYASKKGWRLPWSEDIEKIINILKEKKKKLTPKEFANFSNEMYEKFCDIECDNPDWDEYIPFWCSDLNDYDSEDDYYDAEGWYWYITDMGLDSRVHLSMKAQNRNCHIRLIKDK